ncbi:copia protein [Tanacetum coccineum]|uniref:Copia protein n=1 Tax=Tanacetum coccineum TaxID=301880 RepID=A0ABQ5J9J8_9ASTR
MHNKFEMSMMGELKFFLGIQIHQSPRGTFINQAKYAQEKLNKHGMTLCDSIGTPMATKYLDADLSRTSVDQMKYHSMVRALIWSSKKQDCTSMSLAKSEYVSLSACCAQVLWLRTQLTDYGFHFDKIPMYCDSKAAIAISCDPVQHSRTKHIDVRYHFIKEHVEKGIVELFFVRTEYQLADLFTKALPEDRFKYLIYVSDILKRTKTKPKRTKPSTRLEEREKSEAEGVFIFNGPTRTRFMGQGTGKGKSQVKWELTEIPCKDVVVACWNMALNGQQVPSSQAWANPCGNNVEANDSASGQAEQAEPTVGQDGSGSLGVGQVPNAYDSSVGDVIGLASVGRQPGRTGVSVEGRSSSLASSPSRWTKRKYKQKDLVHKKRTPTQPATLPSTHSQVQVTGIPTQSSAAVGASEWTIL